MKFLSRALTPVRVPYVACILKALTVGLGVVLVGLATAASADTSLPSFRIFSAAPVTPDTAAGFYGSGTTATAGLCGLSGMAAGCSAGRILRAPELKELAKALHYNPDAIYEYVRNAIRTEFVFGSYKGALGASIDSSGSAFDQASLMVELLRASGFTASYAYGDITLTGDQFYAWSGIRGAQAACQYLSAGGIPVIVNNVAGSCSLSGDVTTITLSHVWVRATIGSSIYEFDPALKTNTVKAGIDLGAASGLVAGQALSAAKSGMSTGTVAGTYAAVSNLNAAGLNSVLSAYATNIANRLAQADLQGADLSDIVGGLTLEPVQHPAGGWRQASLSYVTNRRATWDYIPDQYRAKVSLSTIVAAPASANISAMLFGDEVYGRRLEVMPAPDDASPKHIPVFSQWKETLFIDLKPAVQGADFSPLSSESGTYITLNIDHPFAAANESGVSGTYGDVSVKKIADMMMSTQIVLGWGDVSPALGGKWRTENRDDVLKFFTYAAGTVDDNDPTHGLQQTNGDTTRAMAAAQWLAEFSKAFDLQTRLGGTRGQHLHTIGLVTAFSVTESENFYAVISPTDAVPTPGYGIKYLDQVPISLDLETGVAVTSVVNDAVKRRAAIHAVAQVAATLEGSVSEELSNSPDIASTSRRFAWGNAPESADTAVSTSRAVFTKPKGTADIAGSAFLADGSTGNPVGFGGLAPIIPSAVASFRNGASQTISYYTSHGYDVVASDEAILGPGHIVGSQIPIAYNSQKGMAILERLPSMQRGSAFVANQYDANGDPIAIAHIVTRLEAETKGGGGPLTSQGALYDPSAIMRRFKDKFVDRSALDGVDMTTGIVTYQSPVLNSIGQGDFPYRLDVNLEMRLDLFNKNDSPDSDTAQADPRSANIFTNLDGSLEVSKSDIEALGAGRPEYATTTLAAFVALQDIYSASPETAREVTGALAADWWSEGLNDNVVTVHQGASTSQYVRVLDGSYWPASGGDRVTLNGASRIVRPQLTYIQPGTPQGGEGIQTESLTRERLYDNVSATLTSQNGDQRHYEYWSYQSPSSGVSAPTMQGFRLSQWSFPRGITLSYAYPAGSTDLAPTLPSSVTNSLGLSLALSRPTWTLTSTTFGAGVPQVYTTSFTDTLNHGYKVVWSSNANSGVTNSSNLAKIPAASFTSRSVAACCITQVFLPDDPNQANLVYGYDTVGRVKTISDAVAIRSPSSRAPYQLNIIEGYKGERIDPLGGSYSVISERDNRLKFYTDEIGHVVSTALDGRGRVLSRTFPEGGSEQFTYDAHDNVTELRTKPKLICSPQPTCNPADIVVSANYDMTWNKPLYVIDPNNNRTDMTYVSSGAGAGELLSVQQPAVNGVRPTYNFTYASNGKLATQTDPMGIVTQLTYDTKGNLTQQTLDPTGLNLSTTFTSDAVGNVVTTTSPKGQASYATYDSMRKVVFEISADPDGSGAGTPLKRLIVKHIYDVDGREYRTEKGSGSATDGSDFVMSSYVQKTFDAVGNVTRTEAGTQ